MTDGQDRKYQRPQPVTSVQPPLFILADDLTGACDAAVAFTSEGNQVRVAIDGQPAETASVQAITTESRGPSAAEAETRIGNIVERLPSEVELFKKIDSVFRGNTITEISLILHHARYDLAIVAPAHPGLGRIVCDGVLHIRDVARNQTLPIADLLASAGWPLPTLSAGLSAGDLEANFRRCLDNPSPAVLCNTASQDDLVHIAKAARSLGKRILWIGSGGLAQALATERPRLKSKTPVHPRTGHTIFFIGSPHPVTCAQVERLRRTFHITEHGSGTTRSSTTDLLVRVLLEQTSADDIRHAVEEFEPAKIGSLFMTGGDTAHFVCRALGIHALRLEREFAPGVPIAIAEGGLFNGIPVVLKSGGFGEPDLFCRLLESCRPEVTA